MMMRDYVTAAERLNFKRPTLLMLFWDEFSEIFLPD